MAAKLNSRAAPPSALLPYCRDLAEWPQSWMGDERDLLPGQKLVECFTPFLLHLAGSGLSKKTIQKRVDNLQETPKLRKSPVRELVDTVLENDGPLLYHCDSEEQQNSLESTCRKLRRFRIGQLSRP